MSTVSMCNRCLLYKPNNEILSNGSCKECDDNYRRLSRFIFNMKASQKYLKK